MMQKITSLADLVSKAKTDERYRRLAEIAYHENSADYNADFEKAIQWMDGWASRNVTLARFRTCNRMVNYVNRFIHRVDPEVKRIEAEEEE